MLELRPICEGCAVALLPDAGNAMICSFECTFCAECVEGVLQNVCPNCGGGFTARPIRPARNWRGDNFLGAYLATSTRRHSPVDRDDHARFAAAIRDIPPNER